MRIAECGIEFSVIKNSYFEAALEQFRAIVENISGT
jgi:hypothetical protein